MPVKRACHQVGELRWGPGFVVGPCQPARFFATRKRRSRSTASVRRRASEVWARSEAALTRWASVDGSASHVANRWARPGEGASPAKVVPAPLPTVATATLAGSNRSATVAGKSGRSSLLTSRTARWTAAGPAGWESPRCHASRNG